MRRIPVLLALAALVLLAILASTTGSTAARTVPRPATAAVTTQSLVCPDINGTPKDTTSRAAIADVATALTPPSHSTGSVATTVLAGARSTTRLLQPAPSTVVVGSTGANRTVAVTATGSVAATLAADQVTETTSRRMRLLAGVRCAAPATDWWFTGADGRVGFGDVLAVTDPAVTPAEVSITLWSANGPINDNRLESLRLAGRSTIKLGLATVAPNAANVAIHVHSTSGAVTAAVLDHRTAALQSNGGDFIPATLAPAKSQFVAGFAPGAGARQMVVTNPGVADASVTVRAVTTAGTFVPEGDSELVVRGGHSRVINLDRALAGTTGGMQVTSDQPVVAEGASVIPDRPQRPDLMWSAATAPVAGPAPVADGREPDGGHTLLYLSAPQGAAQVRVSTPAGQTQTLSVRAGHSIAVDVTRTVRSSSASWPFVVTPVGSAPVYGVRVLQFAGAHGELLTGEPLVELPKPLVLPPVREDPTVAVR